MYVSLQKLMSLVSSFRLSWTFQDQCEKARSTRKSCCSSRGLSERSLQTEVTHIWGRTQRWTCFSLSALQSASILLCAVARYSKRLALMAREGEGQSDTTGAIMLLDRSGARLCKVDPLEVAPEQVCNIRSLHSEFLQELGSTAASIGPQASNCKVRGKPQDARLLMQGPFQSCESKKLNQASSCIAQHAS